jgi:molecular chaperone GrpE
MGINEKPEAIIPDNDGTKPAAPQPDPPQEESLVPTPDTMIQTLKEERDSLYDRLLRKQAEFENFKKRAEREKTEYVQFASAELIKELLNALDSFDLAIRNASQEAVPPGRQDTLQGFELIYKQLLDTMGRFGLKPIEAKGKKFDPNFHQAVATTPTNDVEENTIVEEMRKGYLLNGRLLRPAMVSVAVKE